MGTEFALINHRLPKTGEKSNENYGLEIKSFVV
jgi:hypothetical protein